MGGKKRMRMMRRKPVTRLSEWPVGTYLRVYGPGGADNKAILRVVGAGRADCIRDWRGEIIPNEMYKNRSLSLDVHHDGVRYEAITEEEAALLLLTDQ